MVGCVAMLYACSIYSAYNNWEINQIVGCVAILNSALYINSKNWSGVSYYIADVVTMCYAQYCLLVTAGARTPKFC